MKELRQLIENIKCSHKKRKIRVLDVFFIYGSLFLIRLFSPVPWKSYNWEINVLELDESKFFYGKILLPCVINTLLLLVRKLVIDNISLFLQQTLKNWRIVFLTASAVYVVTGLVYNFFCTAELQPWGTNRSTGKNTSKQKDKTAIIDNPG